MSTRTIESLVTTLYATAGVEDRDALHTKSQGMGATAEAAASTIAEARRVIAEALPVAQAEALAARVEGTPLRVTAEWLGIGKDSVTKYATGAVLVAQGLDPEAARAEVETATRGKIGKPAQWDAAVAGLKSWRALLATLVTPIDADDEGDDEGTGEGDATDGTTGKDDVTPADRGLALVQGIVGACAGLLAALEDGTATLDQASKAALATAIRNTVQGSGIGNVKNARKPEPKIDAEAIAAEQAANVA